MRIVSADQRSGCHRSGKRTHFHEGGQDARPVGFPIARWTVDGHYFGTVPAREENASVVRGFGTGGRNPCAGAAVTGVLMLVLSFQR